jgi:hypothetical protein
MTATAESEQQTLGDIVVPPQVTLTRRRYGRSGWGYRINGKPITSVTKIIDGGVPKKALQGWYARQVAECVVARREVVLQHLSDDEVLDFLRGAPFRARDAAANRGTEVHRLAADMVAGRPVDPPAEIRAHVEHYAAFLEDFDITDALVERPCFHLGLRYGGTFDLLASSPRVGRALWDIKTSGSGIYPEIALQMAGYAHTEVYLGEAGEPIPMERVDKFCAVWVTPQGYDVFPIKVRRQEWATFRHAAGVASWLDETAEEVVGDSTWSSQVVRP